MRGWALLLLPCLLLSGCSGGRPAGREMGDMALLRTMGVDAGPAGVSVTVSTGPRARGLQGEEEPSMTLSAAAPSLSAACLSMQSLSDSYVFYGYVDQLLLGRELAEQGIRPALDYFARDRELGLGSQLWLVEGTTAAQAMAAGGEEGVDSRLSTLRTDGEVGIAAIPRTAGEVYTDLMERGSAFVPALGLREGEDGLVELGYGVLRDFRLSGVLTGDRAKGLELLAGRASADVIEVSLGEERVSVRIRSARTRPELTFRGEDPAELKVTCRASAQVAEHDGRLDPAELEQLRTLVAERLEDRLDGALEQLQEWQTDCAGLGARAALSHPGKWGKVQADWPRIFGRIRRSIDVQVDIFQ